MSQLNNYIHRSTEEILKMAREEAAKEKGVYSGTLKWQPIAEYLAAMIQKGFIKNSFYYYYKDKNENDVFGEMEADNITEVMHILTQQGHSVIKIC
jgi:hypothetical protein